MCGGLAVLAVVVAAVVVAMRSTGAGEAKRASAPPTVAVFLSGDAAEAQTQQITRIAQVSPGVLSVQYVSLQQATESAQALPEGMRPEKPSAYLLIRARDAAAATALNQAFSGMPGVREVKTSTSG
ncbi:permease-like cell division protein FtsX [Saccharopolyspora sp. 5N102]|uniref:permease-like cell division protein FtsX n=1 Tax=Saccharopolyspora sp. 5N102 TaxID=3375155 RepID=UPI0037A79EF2